MFDVTGRTVLITGGASGIGRGMARAFSAAGSSVAIADLDGERARATSEELSASGGRAIGLELDVRDRGAFAQVVDEIERRIGPVDVLCNNAGIGAVTPVAELTHEDWDQMLAVNLGGVVNGVQEVLPRMLDRGGPGHLVNTASGAGLVATTNLTYSTAKFAVVGLSESLRQAPELLAAGIGVSVLCPGLVRTDVFNQVPDSEDPAEQQRIENGRRLLEAYGVDPDEVGEQVVAAVREGRLHVQTDRTIKDLVDERHRLVLESMPAETDRDRQLTPHVRERLPSLVPALSR